MFRDLTISEYQALLDAYPTREELRAFAAATDRTVTTFLTRNLTNDPPGCEGETGAHSELYRKLKNVSDAVSALAQFVD